MKCSKRKTKNGDMCRSRKEGFLLPVEEKVSAMNKPTDATAQKASANTTTQELVVKKPRKSLQVRNLQLTLKQVKHRRKRLQTRGQ
jgi:hypothetical protein